MDYDDFLEKIKCLFMDKLREIVPKEAYEANPMLPRDVYLDAIYTDIMALGYNFGDQKKAVDDIYESKSWAVKPGNEDSFYEGIARDVRNSAANYPFLVEAFSKSHRAMKNGTDFETIIADVKIDIAS